MEDSWGTLVFSSSNDGTNYNTYYSFQTGCFVPTNATIDLGTKNATQKWRNIYMSGSLRDGNNNDYGLILPDTTNWTANKTIATTDQLGGNTPTIVVALAQVVSAGQDSYTASPYIRFTPTQEQATILVDETITTIKLDLTALGNTAPAPYVWIKRNTQVQVNGNTAYQFSCGGEQYWYDNYLTDIAIKDIGNGALVYVPALSTCDITLASISMPDYYLAMGKLTTLALTTTTGSEAITYDNQTLNVATRDTAQRFTAPKSFFNNVSNDTLPLRIQGFENKTWGLEMDKDFGRLHFKFANVSGTNISNVIDHLVLDSSALYPTQNDGKDLGTTTKKWAVVYVDKISDGTNEITPEQVYYLGKAIQGLAQPTPVNLSNGDTLTDQRTIYMMSQHLPVMIDGVMCYFLTEDTNYYVYTTYFFDSSTLDVVPYKIIINKNTFVATIGAI